MNVNGLKDSDLIKAPDDKQFQEILLIKNHCCVKWLPSYSKVVSVAVCNTCVKIWALGTAGHLWRVGYYFCFLRNCGYHKYKQQPQHKVVCVWELSCVQLFATPWTVAHQALLSMEFSRQECWSGLPFPSPTFLVTIGQFTLYPSLSSDFHIMDCFISS